MKRIIWDLKHHLFLWSRVNVEHTFIWGHFCLERGLMATSHTLHLWWASELYLNACKGSGEHKRSCVMIDSNKPQSWLPHLLPAKLASHSTTRKKADWSDVKPQAAFLSPCPGTSLGKALLGCAAWPLRCFHVLSLVGATAICYMYCFLFLQNNNWRVRTVKSSPLEKRL